MTRRRRGRATQKEHFRENGMHKNGGGGAGRCHFCFQNIKMADLPRVEGLGLGIVGDIDHFIRPKQHPIFLQETTPLPFGSL